GAEQCRHTGTANVTANGYGAGRGQVNRSGATGDGARIQSASGSNIQGPRAESNGLSRRRVISTGKEVQIVYAGTAGGARYIYRTTHTERSRDRSRTYN